MIRSPSCPICRRTVPPPAEAAPHWFPFCSERCRQVDLYRWCEGKYAIVETLTPERLLEQAEKAGHLPPELAEG